MSPAADSGAWEISQWGITLQTAQREHIAQLALELTQALALDDPSRPLGTAWLVFDAWEDNHVSRWLGADYPSWQLTRRTVADPAFSGQVNFAPCLLPLHAWSVHEPNPAIREEALRDIVGKMWLDAQFRMTRQNACGVLLTVAPIDNVLDHWVRLASQCTSGGEHAALRHQDPRVLQRLWPSLNASQRATWLGPAHSYWQLAAGWGPMEGEFREPGAYNELRGAAPQWHVATKTTGAAQPHNAPAPPEAILSANLKLTPAQLHAVENILPVQTLWEMMARAEVPLPQQPGPGAMDLLLRHLQTWRTEHPTPWSPEHASEWLWCTWLGERSAAPLQAQTTGYAHTARVEWQQAPWRELAAALATRLRDEPGLGLRTHFEHLVNESQAKAGTTATPTWPAPNTP